RVLRDRRPGHVRPARSRTGGAPRRCRAVRRHAADRQRHDWGVVKTTIPMLGEMKREGRPIVMITAYDHPSGRIVDAAGVDLVLVGDSAANVVLGHESTVPATMDEMTMLTAAVNRGVENALVIGDLPFMSYQVSDAEAVANAGRLLKAGGA